MWAYFSENTGHRCGFIAEIAASYKCLQVIELKNEYLHSYASEFMIKIYHLHKKNYTYIKNFTYI